MREKQIFVNFKAGACEDSDMPKRVISGCAFALLVALTPLHADDGAASIAAGGIVMKRESRITMAKEVLRISVNKITVDYDFSNDTDTAITTEVAFPIPDYVDDPDGPRASLAGFDDFKLWVNQALTKFQIQTQAYTKKMDITALLAGMKIDAASFGHEHGNGNGSVNDLARLSKVQKQKLVAVGAIDSVDDLEPNWAVRKRYYWPQIFPAHSTVHIRHEYTPVLGSSNTVLGTLVRTGHANKYDSELASVCPTADLLRTLRDDSKKPGHTVAIEYVDFILTTANTWKTPIEDFTLIVQRPQRAKDPNHPATPVNFVSFCWNGPVTKIDTDHFSAHATNFVPNKELRIGFLDGYLMGD